MNQEYKAQSEYEEINFIDYIRIIIKRKSLILAFLLIGLIIAGGLIYLLPKTYQAETYLEIGSCSKRVDRELPLQLIVNYNQVIDSSSMIETPFNLVEKINAGFYGNYSGVTVTNPVATNLIEIKSVSESPEEAKNNLENINKSILNKHNQKIETDKESLKNSIEKLQERINFLLSKNKEVEALELEIFNIQKQIENIQPTKIVKEPIIISERKPNLAFNLICGGLSGLFLGVFLAFGKEWWKKNKENF